MKDNPVFSIVGPRKVRISRLGVALFNAQWPGSRLRSTRSYWYEFDRLGDLIDHDAAEYDGDTQEHGALCDDAKAWMDDGTIPEWARAAT